MATPRTTRWTIEPHTEAKHLILRRYLEAWLPIMARWNGRIHFLDGFAGPGRYAGGEIGSPLIAIQTLLSHPQFSGARFRGEVVFTFVERDAERVAALRDELDRIPRPDWAIVQVFHDEFAERLTRLLDELDAERAQLAPTFVFIDPFGFAGVPIELIGRVMKNRRCECLITFMHEAINRFLGHQDKKVQQHIDGLFGSEEARALLELPAPQRRDGLVELYARQLQVSGAQFVRTFEMINEGNRTEYFLFFATSSLDGLSKMKQAMWRADPAGGQAFSDRTDPRQGVLLNPALEQVDDLRRRLTAHFARAGQVSIADVERFVLMETPYSEAIHLKRRTLAPMEKAKLIEVTRPKGSRQRAGDYPDGTLIRFKSDAGSA